MQPFSPHGLYLILDYDDPVIARMTLEIAERASPNHWRTRWISTWFGTFDDYITIES
jgi:hypothetical protein